ncbi:hypothetical protein ABZ793_12035 [Micromonospora sp. NPDC047465]|uniref:hypothetical protein n=1 Tax=Micromonospora sp. NPDC047465 TaxID=3154813 RepID=UPI00340DDE93
MARLAVALIALTAWSVLCFTAGGWHLRWRSYRHQVQATVTAVRDPQLRADALAWHRRQLPRVLRLHLPHFHLRSVR